MRGINNSTICANPKRAVFTVVSKLQLMQIAELGRVTAASSGGNNLYIIVLTCSNSCTNLPQSTKSII